MSTSCSGMARVGPGSGQGRARVGPGSGQGRARVGLRSGQGRAGGGTCLIQNPVQCYNKGLPWPLLNPNRLRATKVGHQHYKSEGKVIATETQGSSG